MHDDLSIFGTFVPNFGICICDGFSPSDEFPIDALGPGLLYRCIYKAPVLALEISFFVLDFYSLSGFR